MKNLILFSLLTLLVNPLFSQTWKTESGGDDFDGKYKLAYVQGVGEEFPYNEPLMAFIKWSNQEDYTFYIKDADFLQPSTSIEIIFVFDNEPGVFYSVYESTDGKLSLSADGKTAFLNGFRNSEDRISYSKYEILQKLMTASTVSVRFKDKFGQNDTKFNLSGSTKAINFVLPESELNVLVEKAINVRNEELNDEKIKTELVESLIKKLAPISLTESSIKELNDKIKKDLGINWPLKESFAENIVSIKYGVDFESSQFKDRSSVDLFYILVDGSEEEIYPSLNRWIIEPNSILFEEAKNAEQAKIAATEAAIKNVKDILKKYVFQDIIDLILEEIKDEAESWPYDWGWTDIENVKVIFNKKVQGIELDSITVFLNDGSEEELNVYSSRKLKNKELKLIGATLGELY